MNIFGSTVPSAEKYSSSKLDTYESESKKLRRLLKFDEIKSFIR